MFFFFFFLTNVFLLLLLFIYCLVRGHQNALFTLIRKHVTFLSPFLSLQVWMFTLMFNIYFLCAVLLQRRVEEVSKLCENRSKEQEKSFRLNFQWSSIKKKFQSDVNECHCFCYLLQNKIISFTWFPLNKFLFVFILIAICKIKRKKNQRWQWN